MKKIKTKITHLLILLTLILFPLSFQGYIKANAFIDFVIFIDPGHGGKDNGTNYLNVYEDEINLAISEKLYEIFLNKNLMAYMSRIDDYDLASLYASNRKQEDLKKRAELIDHSGCNLFLSIHTNAYSSSSVYGPMVYYEKNNEESYQLALKVQEELNVVNNTTKKVHSDNFYLFRKCETAGILIECGFLSNDEERVKLLNDDYQESIANAIYEGIYQFYISK